MCVCVCVCVYVCACVFQEELKISTQKMKFTNYFLDILISAPPVLTLTPKMSAIHLN